MNGTNPAPVEQKEGMSVGLILGLVLGAILILLLLIYGIPALKKEAPEEENENGLEIDVNFPGDNGENNTEGTGEENEY